MSRKLETSRSFPCNWDNVGELNDTDLQRFSLAAIKAAERNHIAVQQIKQIKVRIVVEYEFDDNPYDMSYLTAEERDTITKLNQMYNSFNKKHKVH